ncbi:hypothetical protein TTHERM_000408792 (macronuclear) [Tetrahymena thermophila SB210]|uniref:Uncharacterized protein n=1 Tax=Tetrahymena thermophila (strain SB210) TaxID=312017 RepID=W7X9U9_TETTS|nr:hypothetical protein TTHERM_000408792 [Tetrahymena thermophila SB210]EWS73183.1 hypothetical protein TTHERM_000408792 [Tetrahymena thermophila SB210]|eukprot:XP_012654259.1 hypothetical protein TTHERM_000408792 [Tetrahymena thermophila SB210]
MKQQKVEFQNNFMDFIQHAQQLHCSQNHSMSLAIQIILKSNLGSLKALLKQCGEKQKIFHQLQSHSQYKKLYIILIIQEYLLNYLLYSQNLNQKIPNMINQVILILCSLQLDQSYLNFNTIKKQQRSPDQNLCLQTIPSYQFPQLHLRQTIEIKQKIYLQKNQCVSKLRRNLIFKKNPKIQKYKKSKTILSLILREQKLCQQLLQNKRTGRIKKKRFILQTRFEVHQKSNLKYQI